MKAADELIDFIYKGNYITGIELAHFDYDNAEAQQNELRNSQVEGASAKTNDTSNVKPGFEEEKGNIGKSAPEEESGSDEENMVDCFNMNVMAALGSTS